MEGLANEVEEQPRACCESVEEIAAAGCSLVLERGCKISQISEVAQQSEKK